MSPRKYYYVLTGTLVFLFILIIGGAVGGNFLLQKESLKLSDLKLENESLESQQGALIQARADAQKYSDLNKITKAIVPQDKDQAKTVREIVAIAEQSGVPIKSVSFQNSTLGDATTPGAGSAKTPVSQVKAVDGIPGVYTLEIQVASNGSVSYQNFLKFLDALEKNRRTAHVIGINLNPKDNGRNLEFNLTLNAYLKP